MKLSIITLTLNKLEYTKNFIESLKKYTNDFELIIVDNGSTDGTDGTDGTGSSDGSESDGDNVEYDKNAVLNGSGLSGRYNNNEMWHGDWHKKDTNASYNDGINEMTTILNNLINLLIQNRNDHKEI